MIRVDIEISVPEGRDSVLVVTSLVSALRFGVEKLGAVVHRITVEQEDA